MPTDPARRAARVSPAPSARPTRTEVAAPMPMAVLKEKLARTRAT
jgi:hypothetical protein